MNRIPEHERENYVYTADVWREHGLGKLMGIPGMLSGIRSGYAYNKETRANSPCVHKDDVPEYVSRVREWLARPRKAPRKPRQRIGASDVHAELVRAYKTIDKLLDTIEELKEQVRQLNDIRDVPKLSDRVRRALTVHGN